MSDISQLRKKLIALKFRPNPARLNEFFEELVNEVERLDSEAKQSKAPLEPVH